MKYEFYSMASEFTHLYNYICSSNIRKRNRCIRKNKQVNIEIRIYENWKWRKNLKAALERKGMRYFTIKNDNIIFCIS